MYDDGMVYDIIEEKVKNNYKFSIIDCNIRTEMHRGDIINPNSPARTKASASACGAATYCCFAAADR